MDHIPDPSEQLNRNIENVVRLIASRVREAKGPLSEAERVPLIDASPLTADEARRIFAFLIRSVARIPWIDDESPSGDLAEDAPFVHCVREAVIDVMGRPLVEAMLGEDFDLDSATGIDDSYAVACARLNAALELEGSIGCDPLITAVCMISAVANGLQRHQLSPDGNVIKIAEQLGDLKLIDLVPFCRDLKLESPEFDQDLVERLIAFLQLELISAKLSVDNSQFHRHQFVVAVAGAMIESKSDGGQTIEQADAAQQKDEIENALLTIYIVLKGLKYFLEWYQGPEQARFYIRWNDDTSGVIVFPALGEISIHFCFQGPPGETDPDPEFVN